MCTSAPTGAPFAARDGAEPDVPCTARQRLGRTGVEGGGGAPDPVVEVVVEGGRRRDVRVKQRIYQRCGVWS